MKSDGMKKTVLVFTLVSILAKIIAFGRELVLSYFFGASATSDAFLLAMTLPVTVFGFVAAGVTSSYIPVYQKAKNENGEKAALRFTASVINLLFILCTFAVVVYFFFSNPVLRLFASGFDDETLAMARSFTNISVFAVFFTALVTVMTGFLQINDRIRITALVSVPLNLGVVVTVVLAARTGNLLILPIGFMLSSVLQAAFLGFFCVRAGFHYSFTLRFKDPYVKLFLSGLVMLVLSSSLQQINVLIDRTLASTVTVGGFSLYEYGSKINDFVMGLTIIPISTAVFPMMAKVRDDPKELSSTLEEGIRLSSFIIIPVSVITVAFPDVIVKIIYYRGAFNAQDVSFTSEIVMFYGVGLLAFSLREIICKCFYSLGNVKTPMINSSIAVVCNIALNFVLLRLIGLGGLALATSVSAFLSVVLLYFGLKKKIGDVNVKKTVLKCLALTLAAAAAGFGARWGYRLLEKAFTSYFIPFLIAAAVFLILYGAMAIACGVVKKSDLGFLKKRS